MAGTPTPPFEGFPPYGTALEDFSDLFDQSYDDPREDPASSGGPDRP